MNYEHTEMRTWLRKEKQNKNKTKKQRKEERKTDAVIMSSLHI